jgi:cytochrome c-type biogenesis protein CcmF
MGSPPSGAITTSTNATTNMPNDTRITRRVTSEGRELAGVVAILGWVSSGLLAFILWTSNPFLRFLPLAPIEGRDLNPLLQDPGFVLHPPILYLGYVGFAVTFALAIYGLLRGDFSAQFAMRLRPWTLWAWSFLTAGITLGSWWAYRELGWGGFWAWDPVENASLLPWIAGTALIHCLPVSAKRNTLKAWTVLLAIVSFSLSLLGTFLVRSGVLTSVHAFAVDSRRGLFILAYLFIVIGGSLALYAWRAQQLRSQLPTSINSRGGYILLNSLILTVILVSILLGTLYPLLIDALGLGKLSVGAPYFNMMLMPLVLPLLVLMGLGPVAAWQGQTAADLWRAVRLRVGFSVIMSLCVGYLLGVELGFAAGLATWVLSGAVNFQTGKHTLGMQIAHAGMAVLVVGIAVNGMLSEQREVRMHPGETISLAGHELRWLSSKTVPGPNYEAVQADFELSRNGKVITHLYPEKRLYEASQMLQTDAAIAAGFWADWYLALGTELQDNNWSVRVYYKPFIRWIWFGGVLMLSGGLIGAVMRKKRGVNQRGEHALA